MRVRVRVHVDMRVDVCMRLHVRVRPYMPVAVWIYVGGHTREHTYGTREYVGKCVCAHVRPSVPSCVRA